MGKSKTVQETEILRKRFDIETECLLFLLLEFSNVIALRVYMIRVKKFVTIYINTQFYSYHKYNTDF